MLTITSPLGEVTVMDTSPPLVFLLTMLFPSRVCHCLGEQTRSCQWLRQHFCPGGKDQARGHGGYAVPLARTPVLSTFYMLLSFTLLPATINFGWRLGIQPHAKALGMDISSNPAVLAAFKDRASISGYATEDTSPPLVFLLTMLFPSRVVFSTTTGFSSGVAEAPGAPGGPGVPGGVGKSRLYIQGLVPRCCSYQAL